MDCYLDMDGVLANLFDVVSERLHGKPYAMNGKDDKAETKRLWEDKSLFVQRVGGVEGLFADLSPYPTNDILLETITRRYNGFFICSHPTKLDPEACVRGKQSWIEKHVTPKYGKYLRGVIFPHRKSDYAISEDGCPNLLIDDYRPFVEEWRLKGGVAVRVRADRYAAATEFSAFLKGELDQAESDAARTNPHVSNKAEQRKTNSAKLSTVSCHTASPHTNEPRAIHR